RWKGAVERDEERLLVVKTRADRFDALREAILAAHPYEVPEVVAVPIEAGSPAYLRWLDETVGEGAELSPDPPVTEASVRVIGHPDTALEGQGFRREGPRV